MILGSELKRTPRTFIFRTYVVLRFFNLKKAFLNIARILNPNLEFAKNKNLESAFFWTDSCKNLNLNPVQKFDRLPSLSYILRELDFIHILFSFYEMAQKNMLAKQLCGGEYLHKTSLSVIY